MKNKSLKNSEYIIKKVKENFSDFFNYQFIDYFFVDDVCNSISLEI